jgi:uncharacterized damage-inducible protein DinB
MASTPADQGPLRTLLARFQDWGEAHLTLEAALEELDPGHRGIRPPGGPHSIWELVEHIRIAQRDILEFCSPGDYQHRRWPEDYWPGAPAPADDREWEGSLDALSRDREALRRLALDPAVEMAGQVPHATHPDQTFARCLLLAQDHAAYHIGQVVLVRRILDGE